MARFEDEELNQLVEGQDTTQELSEGPTTTSSNSNFSKLQAEEWLDQVVMDAEPRRRLLEMSREFDDLVGTGTKELTIPRTNKAMDMSDEYRKDEADVRDFTSMDTLDGEVVTIDDDSWYEGGVKISKQKVMTTPVDVMQVTREEIAKQIARDVDLELYDEAVAAAKAVAGEENNVESNYRGYNDGDENNLHLVTDHPSGSHVVDQTESERLTPDSIAEAQARIEANDWEPFAIVISSEHKKDLRTDSQFTNAAEYGSDEVVLNGEIGMYLGLRVVVSNTVDEEAVVIGQERDTGSEVAQAVIWKEEPEVNYEYEFDSNTHKFFYDQAFEVATVQPTALAVIDTGE